MLLQRLRENALARGPRIGVAYAGEAALGVVLVRRRVDTTVLTESLRAGVRAVLEERNLAGVNAAAILWDRIEAIRAGR